MRWQGLRWPDLKLAGDQLLAGAALYALEHHIDRLQEDHKNAQVLAKALHSIDGITCNASETDTNLVFFDIDKSLGGR